MEIIRPILKNVSKYESVQCTTNSTSYNDARPLNDEHAICWQSGDSPDCQPSSMACVKPVPEVKAALIPNQDSDGDSGIANCEQRIGSTSSTDTDSSQDSGHKSEYCPPVLHKDQLQKINALHFHESKRRHYLPPSGNPVKGDHTILKECNRRPPTPLTVFAEPNHRVRFDEHLHLSEQSVRRSCRKLFATLYAQRFSYPSIHSQLEAANLEECTLLPRGQQQQHQPRNRSLTLPDSDLRRASAAIYEKQRSRVRSSLESYQNKENASNGVSNCRKVVSWNLNTTDHRNPGQMTVPNERRANKISIPEVYGQKDRHRASKSSTYYSECPTLLKSSTDSGLGNCQSRCKCDCSPRNSGGYSSQSSTSSDASTSQCLCYSSEHSRIPATSENLKQPGLFKSNSCSTISKMLTTLNNQQPPQPSQVNKQISNNIQQPCPASLQKTSSCTDIINQVQNMSIASVPIYNDSMMHVYAQVASVVPEETTKVDTDLSSKSSSSSNHIYDTVKVHTLSDLPMYPVPKIRSSPVTFRPYKTVNPGSISLRYSDNSSVGSRASYASVRTDPKGDSSRSSKVPASSSSELYVSMDSKLVPYYRSRKDNVYGSTIAAVRPMTVTGGNSEMYLKPALKNSRTSLNNGSQMLSNISQNGSIATIQSEVEYAIVDKSKKSRFASLPVLNKYSSNSCIANDEDKDEPPVPPKKNLHKSEVDLYRSRSSSPRKSFLEKMNGLTKSAKTVFQKAFSTERIYRPEKEERLESSSKNFSRSKSLMKGLRASISKKRKKAKPPMAEVVPQPNCNRLWDDQQSSINTSTHVRGQLLQLNLDGSQVVELSKPHNKPYGFFVARGRVRNCRGVFVSRMRDQETQKQLAGLLDIGDEILEIEGHSVKNADIMRVNDLMANKNTLLLTVLPYICRKDI